MRVTTADRMEQFWDTMLRALCTSFQGGPAKLKPAIFGSSVASDETNIKCNLRIDSELQRSLTQSSWATFCTTQNNTWCMPAGPCLDDVGNVFALELQRPPVPGLSTTAERTYEAMNSLPQAQSAVHIQRVGLRVATLGLFHYDRDGHFGGAKCSAIMFQELPLTCLATELDCCSHQLNLASNAAMDAMTMTLTTWAYTSCLFLESAGNLVRIAQSATDVVHRYFPHPVRGPPPRADMARAFGDELQSLHERNWKLFQGPREEYLDSDERHEGAGRRRGRARFRQYHAAWQEYRAVFNGWLQSTSGEATTLQPHYYDVAHLVMSDSDVAALKTRAARAIKQLQWRSYPEKPQSSRWTKLLHSFLWFHMVLIQQCARISVPIAYRNLIVRMPATDVENTPYNTEVRYSDVQGSMLRTFRSGVISASARTLITILHFDS